LDFVFDGGRQFIPTGKDSFASSASEFFSLVFLASKKESFSRNIFFSDGMPQEDDLRWPDEDVVIEDDEVATEDSPHDVSGDGSLMKVRLNVGEQGSRPKPGDKCKVHYTGTLIDGTKFDSSVDRGQPFEFTIGRGVITGWSEAAPTLKKGEKARFTIKAHKAYGERGSPPKIPGNATLVFEIEMLSWQSQGGPIDLNNDGKVLKKVLIEGTGWDNPKMGQSDVVVHVEGRTTPVGGHAVIFMNSRASGKPIEWKLGSHELSGLDDIVRSMKRGETCKAIMKASKGFSASGNAGGAVAPGTLIDLDVELVAWSDEESLTKDAGKVLLRKLNDPDGWEKPKDLCKVKVRYNITLPGAGDPAAVVYDTGHNGVQFVVDSAEVCLGLELAVKELKVGQTASLILSEDYAYGPEGSEAFGVPGGATVKLNELTVIEADKPKETWNLTAEEKFARSDELKAIGNEWFQKKDYSRAIRRYNDALDAVDSDDDFKADDEKKGQFARKLPVLLNRAQCFLSQKLYSECAHDCKKALGMESANVKALFRLGCAQLEMGDFEGSKVSLKKVLERDEKNVPARKKLKVLAQRRKEQNMADKKRFGGMFQKIGGGGGFYSEKEPVAKAWLGPLPRVFFDISIGGEAVGKIVIELRPDVVPRY
jgi:FK506-binding protein 4/5